MRQLNGVYIEAFNRRHDRMDHVLQGRFEAIVVEWDSYLLELARYVVLKPVRAPHLQARDVCLGRAIERPRGSCLFRPISP